MFLLFCRDVHLRFEHRDDRGLYDLEGRVNSQVVVLEYTLNVLYIIAVPPSKAGEITGYLTIEHGISVFNR